MILSRTFGIKELRLSRTIKCDGNTCFLLVVLRHAQKPSGSSMQRQPMLNTSYLWETGILNLISIRMWNKNHVLKSKFLGGGRGEIILELYNSISYF